MDFLANPVLKVRVRRGAGPRNASRHPPVRERGGSVRMLRGGSQGRKRTEGHGVKPAQSVSRGPW